MDVERRRAGGAIMIVIATLLLKSLS